MESPNRKNLPDIPTQVLENDSNFDFLHKINSAENMGNFDFLNLGDLDSPYSSQKFATNYLDEIDLPNNLNITKSFIISINIQSLASKYTKLNAFIQNFNTNNLPVVILIQELWHIEDPNLFNLQGYHGLLARTRKGRGGGVGIYIRKDIEFKLLDSIFHERVFESFAAEIILNKKKINIASLYRPNTVPSHLTAAEQSELFFDYLTNLIDSLICEDKKCIIGGDFNLDLLKYPDNQNVSTYLDITFAAGLLHTVHKPTRVQNGHFSCIDHFLTNIEQNFYQSRIVLSDTSDHFPIIFCLDDQMNSKIPAKEYTYRNFNQQNINSFLENLTLRSWAEVTEERDCSIAFDIFLETFLFFFDTHFPIIKTTFNKNLHKKEKWMTKGLMTSRITKMRLQKKNYNEPSDINKANYKIFRNIYNRTVREAKKLYYHNKLSENKDNPKKTWQLLNEITGKSQSQSSIQSLTTETGITSDKKIMATQFNNFFANIALEIAEKINLPLPPRPVDEPVPEINEDRLFNMSKIPLQQGELVNAVSKLSPKKSLDSNGLNMCFLKKILPGIEKPLLYIFSKSLSDGQVPFKLKLARIVPIYKNGDCTNVTNYRPISLICNFAKILEKIVHTKLSSFVEKGNLLSSNQFGFRSGHSTTHPTTLFMNYIYEAFNKKQHVAAIFCDLAKAFDTCDHEILLKVLEKKGIRDTELKWFQSYLSSRSQYVSLGEEESDQLPIRLGVPQGSILGPLLFIIYLNDISLVTNNKLFLFADDTVLLASDSDINSLVSNINREFKKICDFFRQYKLSLNPKKTQYIIFSNSPLIHQTPTSVVIDNNNPGEQKAENIFEIKRITPNDECPVYKYLGIHLDPSLTFKYHIQKILSKLSRALYILRTVKNFLPINSLITLYYSLFHCHIIYGNEIWSSASDNLLNEIYKKQKIAIRLITNSKFNAHTQPLFKKYSILPFPDLVDYTKITLFQSIVQNHAPISLTGTWLTNREHRILNGIYQRELRDDQDYFVPFSRTNQLKRFVMPVLPLLWNQLPPSITIIRKISEFKQKLKEHFLNKIPDNYTCERLFCISCNNVTS